MTMQIEETPGSCKRFQPEWFYNENMFLQNDQCVARCDHATVMRGETPLIVSSMRKTGRMRCCPLFFASHPENDGRSCESFDIN